MAEYEYDFTPVEEDNLYPLNETMESVLTTVVGTLEQAGVDVPERRYITFGQASHDCEQVTVSFTQMYLGMPGDQAAEPQPCNGPRSAVLTVELVRCLPTHNAKRGNAPDPEAVDEYSKRRAVDAWLLLDAAGQFSHYQAVIADVAMTEPQGGYQAVVLNIVAAIE